ILLLSTSSRFQDLNIIGRWSTRAPSQAREVIAKELEYRIVHKIPPGYKDASKDDRGVGDLLIWMTILEIGAERQKPLLFVTGEEKADWQHRSDNRGVLPTPRERIAVLQGWLRTSIGLQILRRIYRLTLRCNCRS